MKKVISNLRKNSSASSMDNDSVNENISMKSSESAGSKNRSLSSSTRSRRHQSSSQMNMTQGNSHILTTKNVGAISASQDDSNKQDLAKNKNREILHIPDDSDAYSTTFKSFQYSYNSNSNSLFSSSRTMSTGMSSAATSSNMTKQRQQFQTMDQDSSKNATNFPSMARTLRVLNEEDFTEDDEVMPLPELKNSFTSRNFSIASSNSSVTLTPGVKYDSTNTSNDLSGHGSNSLTNDLLTSINSSMTSQRVHLQQQLQQQQQPTKLQLSALCEYIERQLKLLSMTISTTLYQVTQSVLNLTKASISIGDTIATTIKNILQNALYSKFSGYIPVGCFNTVISPGLRLLLLKILTLVDNLLTDEVYSNSKELVLKNLYELLILLNAIPKENQQPQFDGPINHSSFMTPSLFAIGSTVKPFPNEDKISSIIDLFIDKFGKSELFSDQDGSFIAPVLRGFQIPGLSVVTFIFGFPTVTKEHQDVIRSFEASSDEIHFMYQSNYIKLAATSMTESSVRQPAMMNTAMKAKPSTNKMYTFKPPFRTLSDSQITPISISLGCDKSNSLSGTLGGYLYPKIDKDVKNSKLRKYENSLFGLTCAHVVLNEETMSDDIEYADPGMGDQDKRKGSEYPNVSIPSPVLINLYKKALTYERSKYNPTSEEYLAYNEAIEGLNADYPEVEMISKSTGKSTKKNLSRNKLGQIVWGERIINEYNNKLSDIAIIKIENGLKNSKRKYLNFLGDDISFNEYDPSLMFSNLQVKEVVNLYKPNTTINLDTTRNYTKNTTKAGLSVFKYGSTTKYTSGNLNGSRIIYWSDGSLKTSEFIIKASSGNNAKLSSTSSNGSGFASGGDSGAWILSKLSDVYSTESDVSSDNSLHSNTNSDSLLGSSIFEQFQEIANLHALRQERTKQMETKTGLGVIGMLHSYDGEFKQFGLFTPMTDILDRLNEVTGVSWGVLGCDNGDGDEHNASEDDEHDLSTSLDNDLIDSDEENESGEFGAPPSGL